MSQASIWFDQHGFVGKPASLLSLSMTQGRLEPAFENQKNTKCLVSFTRVGGSEATTSPHMWHAGFHLHYIIFLGFQGKTIIKGY